MANYIKSEFYRVNRNKNIYIFTGLIALLMLAMNVLLCFMNMVDSSFRYGTMGFSLDMVRTSMNMSMVASLFLSMLIFTDEFKNRTMTNTLAFGMSKAEVMICKYIVTLIVSAICFVFVEVVLVISAYLLLGNTGWGVLDGMGSLKALLVADIACVPLFMAGIAIYYAMLFWTKNEMSAIWGWLIGVIGLGKVFSLLGLKFEVFRLLDKCMIYELAQMYDMDEETGKMRMIWETLDGRIWVIMVGIVTTLVFLALAIIGSRRKD